MSEIEKALREWVGKQEAWDRLVDDSELAKGSWEKAMKEAKEATDAINARTKIAHDAYVKVHQAKELAAGEAREARAKALDEILPGTKFPIVVGEFMVSNFRGPGMRIDKATVIGEAKPKAKRDIELYEGPIGNLAVGAKFFASELMEVVSRGPGCVAVTGSQGPKLFLSDRSVTAIQI